MLQDNIDHLCEILRFTITFFTIGFLVHSGVNALILGNPRYIAIFLQACDIIVSTQNKQPQGSTLTRSAHELAATV